MRGVLPSESEKPRGTGLWESKGQVFYPHSHIQCSKRSHGRKGKLLWREAHLSVVSSSIGRVGRLPWKLHCNRNAQADEFWGSRLSSPGMNP
ncbi:hypothetical protein SKAU_G00078490 [Synaphobranchus kaupii]|uniref:Uncharacterized protein n=1 Tax=Synaphobranchus kaupii TaxID=118154 RepID=A0A9Q1FV60_SYNKA|nr:hypothetical protein SKAU_G00078490 [Synaphobranchus kaupii]